jgi:hypothetical protein
MDEDEFSEEPEEVEALIRGLNIGVTLPKSKGRVRAPKDLGEIQPEPEEGWAKLVFQRSQPIRRAAYKPYAPGSVAHIKKYAGINFQYYAQLKFIHKEDGHSFCMDVHGDYDLDYLCARRKINRGDYNIQEKVYATYNESGV